MRRCRLDIGGKIQAGIIDNLKPLLYQIPRKIQEKTTNKNNCIHEYLIDSLLLQAQDWLPGVWSYRSLLDNLSDWSGHAVGTQCPRLTSNDKQRIGRSRDHLKYFRDWAVPGCRLSGFLEYSGHNNPLFDDFLDFGGRLSSFLKLLGRNASFKTFDYCHSSQRALSGQPAIPCGWPRTGSIVLKFLTEASFYFSYC